nr:protein FLX-like 3 [Physcomitrium patens]|eukprot:XP_024402268.1 protein FLX-like 3 [Physcomitrella patens]
MEQKVTTQHSEIQKLLTENQQIAVTHVALRQELAAAQQEIQRMPSIILGLQFFGCRSAFGYEKKANADQLVQRQAMEKNLVSMARDVEKLRAELTNAEKRQRLNPD